MKQLKAFTLMELLLYMGLMSVFLLFLVQIFTSILDVQLEAEATSSVHQDGRYLLAKMTRDVQLSESITTPATLGGQSNTLVISIGGINNTYSVNSDGNLIMGNNFGNNKLNGFDTSVSNLLFTRLGNDTAAVPSAKHLIKIDYTVTGRAVKTSGVETKNFTTVISTR